jgi:hypothetical protein
MRFSFLALTPVKLISPRRKSRALLGKFMKSLADEYGSQRVGVILLADEHQYEGDRVKRKVRTFPAEE